jgi:hypothetical protein
MVGIGGRVEVDDAAAAADDDEAEALPDSSVQRLRLPVVEFGAVLPPVVDPSVAPAGACSPQRPRFFRTPPLSAIPAEAPPSWMPPAVVAAVVAVECDDDKPPSAAAALPFVATPEDEGADVSVCELPLLLLALFAPVSIQRLYARNTSRYGAHDEKSRQNAGKGPWTAASSGRALYHSFIGRWIRLCSSCCSIAASCA